MAKKRRDSTVRAQRNHRRKKRRAGKARNLAPEYNQQFLEGLDQRTYLYKTLKARMHEITEDLGGEENLSYFKRSLVRHAVWLEAWLDTLTTRIVLGADDISKYTQMLNAYSGVISKLGLKRQARDVGGLQTYLAKRSEGDNS